MWKVYIIIGGRLCESCLCDSEGLSYDTKPFRTFHDTAELLTHTIRGTYRDIRENISGRHPNVYRQVRAGCEFASIISSEHLDVPEVYRSKIEDIPIIRQLLLMPPLILEPPNNKRDGEFQRISTNPLDLISINKDEWLCYPAKVGPLLIMVYIQQEFYELGFSLCNLFELADKSEIQRKPDALYFYGVTNNELGVLNLEIPTVFYDDEENDMLIAAVPNDKKFGYFGYLKKMMLTLHNIKIMKMGRLPFHGAMTRLILKGNRDVTILMMGDTGAGKSETLEAFRVLAEKYVQDLIVIADDMGSMIINDDGKIIGYGTETGAFVRLDDLSPGYAFGQIDRTIIMNASQVNARCIVPVTDYYTITRGVKVDYILCANNYEEVDDDHPILERFQTAEDAMEVFKRGRIMSKGTTTTTGIVENYYGNIFGPVQYQELHDPLADKYFHAFIDAGVYVGQIRTRLGLKEFLKDGPIKAAEALLQDLIADNDQ